jgi:hypothetical protein
MKLVLSLSALLVLGVGAGCNLTQDLGGSTGNNVGTGGFSAVGGGPAVPGGTSAVVGAGGASMSGAGGASPGDAGTNMGTGGFSTGTSMGTGGFSTGVGGGPAGDAGACRASGSTCVAWFDCCSESCSLGVCVGSAPSCADGVKDESETDVDCGGPVCPACALGKECVSNTDCISSACMAGTCH